MDLPHAPPPKKKISGYASRSIGWGNRESTVTVLRSTAAFFHSTYCGIQSAVPTNTSHSLHGSAVLFVVRVVRRGIGNGHFGGLPLRNPLTNLNKIWHGWLRRDATQNAKWHVNRFNPTKGWNVNGLCFFYLFFSTARDQTTGPILTSYTSKRVFLRQLHSFGG